MTETLLERDTELDPSTGEPRCSHIIAPDDKHDATALVMRSRIEGTPLTALCGHVFVATRDAKAYPICSRCKEIREQIRPDEDPAEIPT